MGIVELADSIGRGVGERALHVAKQLAFQDVLAQGRAVERDKRFALTRAVLVDRLGDELLAGACFAPISTLASVGAIRLSRSMTGFICGLGR